MSLTIYTSADTSSPISTEGAFTNPLSYALSGVLGDVIQRRLYVRNDNILYWYSNITVQPIDGGDNLVSGGNGYSWKLYAGDTQPLDEQWDLVTAGASISLSNIGAAGSGDITTFLPFWVRVEVPKRAPIESYQSVVLRISSTEGLV